MNTHRAWLAALAAMLTTGAQTTMAAQDEPPPEATEQWKPVPAVVSAPAGAPPSDAIALFTGTAVDAWEPVKGGSVRWKVIDGALVIEPDSGDLRTRQSFGDVQLHIEFRTVAPPTGEGQGRSNSGVFLMGLYELQVLDSYRNDTYVNGQAAAIYKQHAPLVNASRAPGEWQTYDVIFRAPVWSAAGAADVIPARMTVLHNGVLVQDDAILRGPTIHRGQPAYQRHAPKLPIVLQDHHNRVAFRNIWVRELAPRAAP